MKISKGLQDNFDLSFEKKLDTKEGNQKLKKHLESLRAFGISEEFIEKIVKKAFVGQKVCDILHPLTTSTVLEEFDKFNKLDKTKDIIFEIADGVADDYSDEDSMTA